MVNSSCLNSFVNKQQAISSRIFYCLGRAIYWCDRQLHSLHCGATRRVIVERLGVLRPRHNFLVNCVSFCAKQDGGKKSLHVHK